MPEIRTKYNTSHFIIVFIMTPKWYRAANSGEDCNIFWSDIKIWGNYHNCKALLTVTGACLVTTSQLNCILLTCMCSWKRMGRICAILLVSCFFWSTTVYNCTNKSVSFCRKVSVYRRCFLLQSKMAIHRVRKIGRVSIRQALRSVFNVDYNLDKSI